MNLPSKSPTAASELGRYQVIASLGQGGMAHVYLALMSGPVGFNKLLVVKVLRDDVDASGDEMMAMFLDEARLSARLNHRCIVQTYEVGEVEGRCFIAMEYLEGQPLRAAQRRLRPGRLPIPEELRILAETAHGLHYAHELADLDGTALSVVHRDVSPQNVFLTYDGQVKLLDFGIAKTSTSEHETRVGVIKGKLDYIAPEQLRGDPVDRRADVFALGAMLWEVLTGKRFSGGPKVADATKIHARLTGGEQKVRDLNPGVPEKLAQLLDEALVLDPSKRLATAAEFAARIEAHLATLSQRPSDKTLAALLAPRFAEERASLHKVVEARVQAMRERGRARSLDSLQASQLRPLDLGMTSSGFVDVGIRPESGQSDLWSSSQPLPAQTAQTAQAEVPRASHKRLLAAGAAGVVLAALGFAWLGRAPAPPLAAAAPAVLVAAAPRTLDAPAPAQAEAPSASRATVKLTLTVSPAHAQAKLDGAPLGAVPFAGSFPAGDALHHLEVTADGHQTVRKLVTFQHDVALTVTLEPVRALARRPVRQRAPTREPATAQEEASAAAPIAAPPAVDRAPASPADAEHAPGDRLRNQSKSRRFDKRDPYES